MLTASNPGRSEPARSRGYLSRPPSSPQSFHLKLECVLRPIEIAGLDEEEGREAWALQPSLGGLQTYMRSTYECLRKLLTRNLR